MATPTMYEYQKIAEGGRLRQEIIESSISTALDRVDIISEDVYIYFKDALSTDDKTVLDALVAAHVNTPLISPQLVEIEKQDSMPAFADKTLPSGQKLFRRKHGAAATIPANTSGTIDFVVPYTTCKINEAEIVNCAAGDQVDLKVYDNAAGTISTVPNYMLNQFGFLVEMPDGIYVDESDYDADLILGMKVEITYHNNSNEERRIGANVTFHQVI